MSGNEPPAETDKPLGTLLLELRDEGLAFARAQAALVKVEAGEKARGLAVYAGIAILALTLVIGALLALLVGLVLVLSVPLGTGWATALVVVATLLLAAALGFVAWSGVRRLFAPGRSS